MLLVSVLPVSADAVIQSNYYSPQITLTGNCELRLTFDVLEGEGWLEMLLYDADSAITGEDNISQYSPNCLRLRKDDGFLFGTQKDWHNEIAYTGQYSDKRFTVGTGYELTLNRWENRIAVTIIGSDGTTYWDLVYKAKTDMADTLYYRFRPSNMTLENIVYTIGETKSITDTMRWSMGSFLAVSLIGVILLFVLNFIFSRIENDFFYYTNFNFVTGGLWGFALITALGLAIPATRKPYCTLLGSIIGLETIPLVQSGVFLWMIVAVCAVAAIGYWVYVLNNCCENPIAATLLMLLFGIVHTASWYFVIGVTIRMILGGIALAIVLLVLTGVFQDNRNNGDSTTASSENTLPKSLCMNGKLYYVSHGGEDYLYIYPSNGDNRNSIRVHKTGEHSYSDDNMNDYFTK